MKKQRYLAGVLTFIFALGVAYIANAQDAPQKNEGKATIEGKAGDRSLDLRVQGRESNRDQPQPGREGSAGPAGPAGAPGPRGPEGPSGPAGGEVMGMDPTIALLVGLGVLAVVIVAIVAASRGRE